MQHQLKTSSGTISIFMEKHPKPLILAMYAGLVCTITAGLGWFFYTYTQVGHDFEHVFYPAGKAILGGVNPYDTPGFFSPPWIIPILALFALPPMQIAWSVYSLCSLVGHGLAFKNLGASPGEINPLILSAWVVSGLSHGNVDWLVLLGATFPPIIGIWLVTIKPQIGAVLVVLWAYRAYRSNGSLSLIWLLSPIVGIGLLAYSFGYYQPFQIESLVWNTSLYPWLIPVGVFFAVLAFNKNSDHWALASAPMLSPYVAFYSWITVLLPLIGRIKLLIFAMILSWIMIGLR